MNEVIDKYSVRNAKLIDGGEGLYTRERVELFKTAIGPKRCKVLDLGSNHGTFTKHFVDDYNVTAVDFDATNLELLAKRFKAKTIVFDLNQDISRLSQERFDAIIMTEVLEHLFWPEEKVVQIATLLKEEGVFVGTVPNGFSLANRVRYLFNQPEKTTMAEPTHITHFSEQRLRRALNAAFREVTIRPIGKASHQWLATRTPNLLGYLLAFECRGPKNR